MNDLTTLPETLFITGIGTDVGKSYATGWLARELRATGVETITQKFIQTGNRDFSEDIEIHRHIMGIPPTPDDRLHITAPVIYSYPASPDLAARIDERPLDLSLIDNATEALRGRYDRVLVEGAGGIMVPIDGQYLTVDYVADRRIPTIVVTNGQLGSINHTLLTLYALEKRGIPLAGIIYNPHFDADRIICEDTRAYLRNYLALYHPEALWLEMPADL
ncbi:MAG: dethiobiotin synthase [Muribaculaceae bacterium]|nr:dethiobiotin synthase [Muribaculaceae bacterium]